MYVSLFLSIIVIISQSTYLPERVSATAIICVHPFCHNKASERARAVLWWSVIYITRLFSAAFLADRSFSRASSSQLEIAGDASLIVSVERYRCQTHRGPSTVCHFNVTNTRTTRAHSTRRHAPRNTARPARLSFIESRQRRRRTTVWRTNVGACGDLSAVGTRLIAPPFPPRMIYDDEWRLTVYICVLGWIYENCESICTF